MADAANSNFGNTGTGDGTGDDGTVWLWVGAAVVILIAVGAGIYFATRPDSTDDASSAKPPPKSKGPPPPKSKPANVPPPKSKPANVPPPKPAAAPKPRTVQAENIVRDCVSTGRIPDDRPGRQGFCRCAPDKKWSATEKACVFKGIGATPCGTQASVTEKTGGRAMRAFQFYGWGLRKGQCCMRNNNKLCKTPEEWVTATDVPGKAAEDTEDSAPAPVAANDPAPTVSTVSPKPAKKVKAPKPSKEQTKPVVKPATKPPPKPAAAKVTAAAVEQPRTCSAGKVDNGTKCIDGPTLCAGKGKVWSDSQKKCVSDKSSGSSGSGSGSSGSGSSGSGTAAGGGEVRKTTLTAYNIMSDDNTGVGELNEWIVGQKFVDNVNVVAIDGHDWPAYKYKILEITYKGKSGQFQVWDYCADGDCPKSDQNCCTNNKNHNGNGFLTDIDAAAAKRIFGVSNAEENLFDNATFRVVGQVDPNDIARKFGAKPS